MRACLGVLCEMVHSSKRHQTLQGPRLTKREALARYKLSTHKPNINAYVVYASTASAREAAAQLNAYNFSISWNSKKGASARGSLLQMEAWRVLRCDVASGAPFVAHLSIFVGGIPYKVRHVGY